MDAPPPPQPPPPGSLPLLDWIEAVTLLHTEGTQSGHLETYCRIQYSERPDRREVTERLRLAMAALELAGKDLIAAGTMEPGPCSLPRPVAVALHRIYGGPNAPENVKAGAAKLLRIVRAEMRDARPNGTSRR